MKKKIIFFGNSSISRLMFINIYNKLKKANAIIKIIVCNKKINKKSWIIKIKKKKSNLIKNTNIKIIKKNKKKKTKKIIKKKKKKKIKMAIIITYGNKIEKEIIKKINNNLINIHFSILPNYKGADPIKKTIEKNNKKTGITIIKINEKLDSGKIFFISEEIQKENTKNKKLNKKIIKNSKKLVNLIIKKTVSKELIPRKQINKIKKKIIKKKKITKQIDLEECFFKIYKQLLSNKKEFFFIKEYQKEKRFIIKFPILVNSKNLKIENAIKIVEKNFLLIIKRKEFLIGFKKINKQGKKTIKISEDQTIIPKTLLLK